MANQHEREVKRQLQEKERKENETQVFIWEASCKLMEWQIENNTLLLACINMSNRFQGIIPGLEYYKMAPQQKEEMSKMLEEARKHKPAVIVEQKSA